MTLGPELRIDYRTSPRKEPLRFETEGSYAGRKITKALSTAVNHGLSEIINALIDVRAAHRLPARVRLHHRAKTNQGVEPTGNGYWQFKDPQLREGIPLCSRSAQQNRQCKGKPASPLQIGLTEEAKWYN